MNKEIKENWVKEFDKKFKDDTIGEDEIPVIISGDNEIQDCERIKSFFRQKLKSQKQALIDQLDIELQYAITNQADIKRVRNILKMKLEQ